ncbi:MULTISPECIES: flagellar basal body-associated FliL family protein [Paenibacillus]|uniref:Flagellar protein FliL n=1 Tax=Paenibacillus campinasensis TaxID=66347 RepID=A0A268ESB8_9BACL|nr:flagellar basal body-associated FliL family protein [Paenibacillus campinasensis]MUG66753.1 flagellar basal body protein FliL [Paenibacillus campinasensis]PAD75974.1 flagellar basal body protein FliL [Paenibacillus campinasensis]
MKKMFPWIITIMLSITLIVLAVFVLSNSNGKNDAQTAATVKVKPHMSADEIVEVTSEITGIKTNLADPDYIISVAFSIQLSDKKAKEEFDKIKDIKIKPIIIKTLADTNPDTLNGSKGREQFTSKLMDLVNESITTGKVVQIDIADVLVAGI